MTPDRERLEAADRAARVALLDAPVSDVLLVAPPGCGKTEGLALRAEALIARGAIAPPQRLLGLTFSNRARSNLKERLAAKLLSRTNRVTVTNFHGLSSRLIRAHSNLLDLDGDWLWPQRGWRAALLAEVTGGNWGRRDRTERALREAKSDPVNDTTVLDRLRELGATEAVEFERRRVAERRFDYQDVLRHAQRLLRMAQVRRVYRLHFAAVLLDEAQDLTSQQLDIALSIGEGRMTSAADLGQGIYSFAGANAHAVVERLRSSSEVELRLHRSFRSADAVLACVNALSDEGIDLIAADPNRWPDPGVVAVVRCKSKDEEVQALVECLLRVCDSSPEATIGILSRDRYRRSSVLQGLTDRGTPSTFGTDLRTIQNLDASSEAA